MADVVDIAGTGLLVPPGVSRSAARIIGPLLLREERRTAAEHSFFAAVPVLFGAALLQLPETAKDLTLPDGIALLLGSPIACASLAIGFLLAVVSRHGFTPFAIYRVLLGSLLLVFVL